MIRAGLAMVLVACAASAMAQVFPTPSAETPRIQSVMWQPGNPITLTALPESALTVILDQGETIQRAVLSGNQYWDVTISPDDNSFQVTPQVNAGSAALSIQTNSRQYEFTLETSESLQAAFVVRLEFPAELSVDPISEGSASDAEPTDLDWSYRLRGDRSVRPVSIRDNGAKTVIEYAPGQALPAVFAIGATGDEEVVDGHMRGDKFVIDRVHDRLVFRIDKEKATARRNKSKDGEQ